MALYNKIKWVLGILLVFILILITNLVDKNNFTRVKDSVVTIYEDRLIASDIVFEMFKLVKEKEVAAKLSDTTFYNHKNEMINASINDLVFRFENTKLTTKELSIFNDLKDNLESLKRAEKTFMESHYNTKSNPEALIAKINNNLDELSEIQLIEGRRQMSITKKALSTVELFTQIEIGILIFLAIVIQIIVMYKSN
ncbi:MCP four helix bundle domain-containing protein [Flavobacteriaceae bacterium XHP0103]|uniref:MCP four helix bundle domain-containing protein n=1 Tax=Marixanthotalea marina TaxID=2844359 RepID=UPI002989D5FE|nr:MCP four helix bundle domain-containing protein [Marixanthotalea marina]MBU3820621.1 MCP four helix bundle domain-containing protein [Marixanthotalea marina]